MNEPFMLRQLGESDAATYRELRLEGLSANPDAFGASFEEEECMSLSWFEDRLENNIIFGGYANDHALVGVAGLMIPTSTKLRHKGTLWGMFLRPEARGTGLARSLAERIIERAEGIVEEVLLTVVTSNVSAVRLYEDLGFEKYGLERRALKVEGRYSETLLMALILKES